MLPVVEMVHLQLVRKVPAHDPFATPVHLDAQRRSEDAHGAAGPAGFATRKRGHWPARFDGMAHAVPMVSGTRTEQGRLRQQDEDDRPAPPVWV